MSDVSTVDLHQYAEDGNWDNIVSIAALVCTFNKGVGRKVSCETANDLHLPDNG